MNMATLKQKEFIRRLFLGHGFSWGVINPLEFWDISKEEADELIQDLKVAERHYTRDLLEMICESVQGKHILCPLPKTIDQIEEEEEQAVYEPARGSLLEQLGHYPEIQEPDWTNEWRTQSFKKYMEAVENV